MAGIVFRIFVLPRTPSWELHTKTLGVPLKSATAADIDTAKNLLHLDHDGNGVPLRDTRRNSRRIRIVNSNLNVARNRSRVSVWVSSFGFVQKVPPDTEGLPSYAIFFFPIFALGVHVNQYSICARASQRSTPDPEEPSNARRCRWK